MNTRFGGVWVLELTTQSAADNWQRLATEILTKLEELEEAEAVALEVVRIEAMAEGDRKSVV